MSAPLSTRPAPVPARPHRATVGFLPSKYHAGISRETLERKESLTTILDPLLPDITEPSVVPLNSIAASVTSDRSSSVTVGIVSLKLYCY